MMQWAVDVMYEKGGSEKPKILEHLAVHVGQLLPIFSQVTPVFL